MSSRKRKNSKAQEEDTNNNARGLEHSEFPNLSEVGKEMESLKNYISLLELENEKHKAVQNVKSSFDKIREWITMRETELLDSINTSTQAITRELASRRQQLNNNNEINNNLLYNPSPKHTISLNDFDDHAINSFISKLGKITVTSELPENTNNSNNNAKKTQVRDYKVLLPDGKQKCKRVYGPHVSDTFGRFNTPRNITIIPKHFFEINNTNVNNNNDANTDLNTTTSSSSSNTQQTQPFSTDDILAVSNHTNARVILIEKTSGQLKSIIGKPGREAGELSGPIGTAVIKSPVHPNLILLVAEKNERVQSFDITTGQSLNHFRHNKMQRPWGICVNHHNGHIIIANYATNVISIHTGYTNNISQFGELIQLVGNNNDGITFRQPTGVALNSRGDLIVSSEHKIDILNSDYILVKTFGSLGDQNRQFTCPYSLCVDALDNILVTDYTPRVQVFDREGNWITTFGKKGKDDGSFENPCGIAVDNENGGILVVDQGGNRVMVF
eukprot:TRINITY_DN3004_c0_g1_i1.p1 TRINITY_DN3004_c0_g1~~TRINITY_DN3004_c0_g1_i1.p1  ORF type:complete len:501 (+),score=107.62 TRINITY_DN3004_c0_g1_i1:294-1796(+)